MKKFPDTYKNPPQNTSFLLKVYIVSQYFNASRCIDSTYSWTGTDSLENFEAVIFKAPVVYNLGVLGHFVLKTSHMKNR